VNEITPTLRILRGNPSDDEIAAVVVVLTAASGSAEPRVNADNPVSAWADPAQRLRQPPRPGPGAWQASART
jgi:hypothetical protein